MSNVNDLPPWKQACLQTIKELGPDAVPCSDELCSTGPVSQYLHVICTCQPPYLNGCAGPNPPPDCCAYSQASPVPVISANCYCCCGSADEMEVAGPGGEYRPIREYQAGDEVVLIEEIDGATWTSARVAWSGGVADAGGSGLELRFADADGGGTITMHVTRDQLFLTRARELRPAHSLVAGEDALLDAAGRPRSVLSVRPSSPGRPLHHVATTTTPATSPAGHLLVANGVICGDWALQIGHLTTRLEVGEVVD